MNRAVVITEVKFQEVPFGVNHIYKKYYSGVNSEHNINFNEYSVIQKFEEECIPLTQFWYTLPNHYSNDKSNRNFIKIGIAKDVQEILNIPMTYLINKNDELQRQNSFYLKEINSLNKEIFLYKTVLKMSFIKRFIFLFEGYSYVTVLKKLIKKALQLKRE